MKLKKLLFVLVVMLFVGLVACKNNEPVDQTKVVFDLPENATISEKDVDTYKVLNGVKVYVNEKETSIVFVDYTLKSTEKEGDKNYNIYTLSINIKGTVYTTEYKVEVIPQGSGVISILEAIELAGTLNGYETEEEYVVKGKIVSIVNGNFGSVYISDGTNQLYVYGIYGPNNEPYDTLEEMPLVGDIVTLKGKLGYFKDQPEMKKSVLLEFEKGVLEINPDLTLSKISAVRTVADNTDVLVEGTVLSITYADGMVPDGFMLADETGQIYVYGKSVTTGVKVGNKVKIQGTKVMYISESEQGFASKYGYKGVCQIDKALMVENDKQTNNVDAYNDLYETKTIKEIVDNNVENDITSKVFKVKCIVNKSEGSGFVNYYLNDVDNSTGSYTYTKCSGSDFSWLDQYDGKYVEMLVSPINCKSTSTGCIYRFLPIKVLGEATFNMELDDYAFNYIVDKAISEKYAVGSVFELPSSFTNEMFNISGTISYESSDSSIVSIDGCNVTVHQAGECNIIATINGEFTKTYKVLCEVGQEGASVKTAIDAADDDVVTIKGIIASSLVNRNGFYIMDETGMIAVVMKNAVDLETLKIGEEVVITGIKSHIKKSDASNLGQTVIKDAEILTNNHGNHPYPTTNIITDKTLSDFSGYDINTDYTTNIYQITAKVEFEIAQYYSNCKLVSEDGKVTLSLYCSSANQYEFLKAYDGQVVTLHIALCNWNSKTYYTGCVISVLDGDKIVVNNCNFK